MSAQAQQTIEKFEIVPFHGPHLLTQHLLRSYLFPQSIYLPYHLMTMTILTVKPTNLLKAPTHSSTNLIHHAAHIYSSLTFNSLQSPLVKFLSHSKEHTLLTNSISVTHLSMPNFKMDLENLFSNTSLICLIT